MCGVVGYAGKNEALPILMKGLARLEYRGYDSAGIAVKNGKDLRVAKKEGKLDRLAEELQPIKIFGNLGIAHTRWATHGDPNDTNAHPHLSETKVIAIVHNGIVENWSTLKRFLIDQGRVMRSDTDSEVIAYLVENFYDGNLEAAVVKTLKLIKGTYGLLVIHKDEDRIIAARKGSPLVIGKNKDGVIVASDPIAIRDHTDKVVYLDDGEIAIIEKKAYTVKNLNGDHLDKRIEEITYSVDSMEKGGYAHHMLKEIFEQPEAIKNTLRGRIEEDRVRLSINLGPHVEQGITIVACGTSYFASCVGKYLIEKLARIRVNVEYAHEYRYNDPIINPGDLVIAVSQSGETIDTKEAIVEAKRRGAITMGIINVVGSSIAREVDSGIYLHAGPEIGVASTKAFSCQVVAFLLLAFYLQQRKDGKVDQALLKELKEMPSKVWKTIEAVKDQIPSLASEFKDRSNFLYLAKGINEPVCREAALKMEEISYIFSKGYPAAEIKHGPIALVDDCLPAVCIAPRNHVYEKMMNTISEIHTRHGNIIAIVNDDDEVITQKAHSVIKVPQTSDIFSPLICIVPVQLLAYHVALLNERDVDKPRNLAKSVTVE